MPIDTPKQALTLDELPTASANDAGIQAVVTTATGAKKLPLSVLFEPYTLLIGSYQYYVAKYPWAFSVPVLGGVLDPADFEDNLQTLKERVPNTWIDAEGKIHLPLVFDHVLQQDVSLQLGAFQEDAVQNVTGFFGGMARHGSNGAFRARGREFGMADRTAVDRNASCGVDFALSYVARTANKTRENTLNALLCIITGSNKATETKCYFIRDAMTGVYYGWQIQLALGRSGEGIGFNPKIMTTQEPPDYSQADQAQMYAHAINSDPIGIALRLHTRAIWTLDYFNEIYRKFRIGGVDVYFSASNSGVRLLADDGKSSINLIGTPAYNTSSTWGSGYGITYHSTSVVIEAQSHGMDSFTIVGLPQVTVNYRVKEKVAVLSLVSNGKELDQSWWDKLREKCPPDKLADLETWQKNMPIGIYNAANTNDTLDSNPRSRFYFVSDLYQPHALSQGDLESQFRSLSDSDSMGIYANALSGRFKLSDFVDKEQRTFMLEGFPMELELDNTGIKWTAPGGYYLRIAANVSVGNLGHFHGQNQSIIFSATTQSYFVGGPNIAEIQATGGWTIRYNLTQKEGIMFFSFSQDNSYFDLNRINDLIRLAPAGREQDIQKCFEYLPKNWGNTVNNDTMGSNWGTAMSRFWMKGGKVNG